MIQWYTTNSNHETFFADHGSMSHTAHVYMFNPGFWEGFTHFTFWEGFAMTMPFVGLHGFGFTHFTFWEGFAMKMPCVGIHGFGFTHFTFWEGFTMKMPFGFGFTHFTFWEGFPMTMPCVGLHGFGFTLVDGFLGGITTIPRSNVNLGAPLFRAALLGFATRHAISSSAFSIKDGDGLTLGSSYSSSTRINSNSSLERSSCFCTPEVMAASLNPCRLWVLTA